MAKRTASAKKQARAGARRSARNRGTRSEVKTLIVKARRSLRGSGATGEGVVDAIRALDRAAAKGILHPNNAARRKSRLARQMAKVAKTAAAAPAATATSGGRGRGKAAASAPAPAASGTSKKK